MMKVLLRVFRSIYTFLSSIFRPKHKVEKINIEINLEEQSIDVDFGIERSEDDDI